MAVQVVLVHGIRTSATMWRSQVAHLTERGVEAVAVDLPGHGTRMAETFTLTEAHQTIDRAVRRCAARGPVLLVGHSMGGLLSIGYAGGVPRPPLGGLMAVSCSAIPKGVGLATYRALARGFDSLPDRGQAVTRLVLDATLPPETRDDFGAGGYAYDAQDVALKSLAELDVLGSLSRIGVPTWFVNGQFDQLRVSERQFTRLVPGSELIVVPRASHLVTAMCPERFNAILDGAIDRLGGGVTAAH